MTFAVAATLDVPQSGNFRMADAVVACQTDRARLGSR
jgi:hypothetical protein